MTTPGFQAQQAAQQAQQAAHRAQQAAQWSGQLASRRRGPVTAGGSAAGRLLRLVVALIIMAGVVGIGLALLHQVDPGWFAQLTA